MIDFHIHVFTDKLAGRALANLSRNAGGMAPLSDGTLEGTLRLFKQQGVEAGVVANIATRPGQQHVINQWAVEHNHLPFIQFGSIHPEAPDALEELEYIAASGLKGVKFHPEYQDFFVDEPRMKPIYKKIASLGLITIFHAGLDIGMPLPCHCPPDRLARALTWFDGGPVVAAHMGGWLMYQEVMDHLVGLPVYFDTAYCAGHIPVWQMQALIEAQGTDRILLGSDLPWGSPAQANRMLSIILGEGPDLEKIVSGNARRLLKLT